MRYRCWWVVGTLCVTVVVSSGCQRWRERWRNRDPYAAYSSDPFSNRRDQSLPGYPAPYPYYGPPPAGIPVAPMPPGASSGGGAPEVLTPQPMPSEVKPPSSSMYRPPAGGTTPRLAPSPSHPSTTEPPLARATPPVAKNPPSSTPKAVTLPPDLAEPRKTEPSTTIPPQNVPDRSWTLPVGIPFYFEVKEGRLATGHRPDTEGLDWLKSRGFRTILHVRRPGSDSSADREQIEKRGMQYVSLDVAAAHLDRRLLDQFGEILADASRQPLFVYDDDGMRVGTLWYGHLRLVEKLPDDLARTRAELYGFKEKGSTEAEALAAALKKLLDAEPSR